MPYILPMQTLFLVVNKRDGVPLCTGRPDGRTKPPKYSQKQKDLGVDRVAPDKLQPFTVSTPIKERICL